MVTCFVTNDDFAPAASQPVACEDNTLCDQTQKIHIMVPGASFRNCLTDFLFFVWGTDNLTIPITGFKGRVDP